MIPATIGAIASATASSTSAAAVTWGGFVFAGLSYSSPDTCVSPNIEYGTVYSSNFSTGYDHVMPNATVFYSVASSADGQTIIGVRYNGGAYDLFTSTNGGQSFTQTSNWLYTSAVKIYFLNGYFIVWYSSSSSWGFKISSDNGANWTQITGSQTIAWGTPSSYPYGAGYANGYYWFNHAPTTWSSSAAPTSWGTSGSFQSATFPLNTGRVIYSGGTYIVSRAGIQTSQLSVATTLGTWTTSTTPLTGLHTITQVGSTILGCCQTSGSARVYPITGVSGTTLTYGSVTDAAYPGGGFITDDGIRFGIVQVGTTTIYSSTNGTVWTSKGLTSTVNSAVSGYDTVGVPSFLRNGSPVGQ